MVIDEAGVEMVAASYYGSNCCLLQASTIVVYLLYLSQTSHSRVHSSAPILCDRNKNLMRWFTFIDSWLANIFILQWF